MKRVVFGIVSSAAVVFASCQLCNLRLYIPRLTFELPEAEATAFEAGPSLVTTCLDDTCWENAVEPTSDLGLWAGYDATTRRLRVDQQRFLDGGMNGGRTIVNGKPRADVSLSVSRDGGVIFSRAWQDVNFTASEPNGTGCGTAYTADVLTF